MKQPKCTEHQMHLHFIKRRAGHQLQRLSGRSARLEAIF